MTAEVSLADIVAARELLEHVTVTTPMEESRWLSALAGGRVADPSARDADTLAARELARVVREEPRLVPALVPVGAGLLAAVKVDAPPV